VLLSPEKFNRYAKPSESSELSEYMAANRVGPQVSHWKGKKLISWIGYFTDWDNSAIWELKELGSKWGLCSNKWQERDQLVIYRGKIYSPHDGQLRLNIVMNPTITTQLLATPAGGRQWNLSLAISGGQGWATMWWTTWRVVTYATAQRPTWHPHLENSFPTKSLTVNGKLFWLTWLWSYSIAEAMMPSW